MVSEAIDFFAQSRETDGLVIIPREDAIYVWLDIVQLFWDSRYTIESFCDELKSPLESERIPAVRFAQGILAATQKKFGDGLALGRAMSDGSVHRWNFENDRFYVCGTMRSAQIFRI